MTEDRMRHARGVAAPLEMWGGPEPSVIRVGDRYTDQIVRTGHAARLNDLDRFAALGLRTLRYPVLWERTVPDGLAAADWSWPDERLSRMRALGIRPVVGLLHHGSGPPSTSLLDPAFPEKLAAYARAVAERYPWVDAYTPVNEPLTTARFAGLYGVWYPHGRHDSLFARALLNQCRGIVLAMREIRRVNPAARLVQTEDLGKTWSTRAMARQAHFYNDRRWLTYDLLLGRVDRYHPLRGYFRDAGIADAALNIFLDEPCPPDLMGFNYYVTGERFLDERTDRYPAYASAGRRGYTDVEAVRVMAGGIGGIEKLLREAWERYGLPLAVTEAQLACTREEQMRWLYETWNAAGSLRRSGVDVRAVTAWALLGAYDWHILCTRETEYYEPGAFDVRSPAPRPTALAGLVRDLAQGRTPTDPLLDTPGWWRRDVRFEYPPVPAFDDTPAGAWR